MVNIVYFITKENDTKISKVLLLQKIIQLKQCITNPLVTE